MKETRIMPSDPRYDKLRELYTLLNIAVNPHVHRIKVDVPEAEHKAIIATLKSEIEEVMKDGKEMDRKSDKTSRSTT